MSSPFSGGNANLWENIRAWETMMIVNINTEPGAELVVISPRSILSHPRIIAASSRVMHVKMSVNGNRGKILSAVGSEKMSAKSFFCIYLTGRDKQTATDDNNMHT